MCDSCDVKTELGRSALRRGVPGPWNRIDLPSDHMDSKGITMRPFFFLLLLPVPGWSKVVTEGEALECYVCEPKAVADIIEKPSVRLEFPFNEVGDCVDFDELKGKANASETLQPYVRECPKQYSNSCIKAVVGVFCYLH
ncbi:unnamed protein product [Darwinula stevensoni]|uniref:Uncharacterized protein n=1 Tax=Darwinula stevensoni TaxID=69355 RepID=A0A7R8XAP4_9CRUS|nr:unnamed protein product [Darwinula stevensoni]CAG0885670.1 unnamed protein product [Darwinula stevensoni]